MSTYFLDTSALLKRYKSETGSQIINELFQSATVADEFYISAFSTLEMTAAVARPVRGNQLDRAAASAILAQFRSEIRTLFEVWSLDDLVVATAITVAENFGLRSGDSIQLATALDIRSDIEDPLTIVVSDRELAQAAHFAGLEVLNPEETPGTG